MADLGSSSAKKRKNKKTGTPGKKGLINSTASTPVAGKSKTKAKTPKLKTPKASAAVTPKSTAAAAAATTSTKKSGKKEKKLLKSAKKKTKEATSKKKTASSKKRVAEAEPGSDDDDENGSGNEAGPAVLDFDSTGSRNTKDEGDGDNNGDGGAGAGGADPKELEECNTLLTEMTPKLEAVTNQAATLLKRVDGGKLDTTKGISLLEVKVQLMLSYNVALGIFMMLKLEGKKIEGHPVVERMAYLRTLLEKLRPIEARLKYQIDKVLRSTDASAVAAGEAGGTDPLSHKPNPAGLQPKQRGDADRGAGQRSAGGGGGFGGLGSGDGVYKPPRMSAMMYDEDISADAKKARKAEKDRLRLLNSDMMQELRSEFSSAPREESHSDAFKSDAQAALQEREDIEENNFVRFGGRKKLIKARARMTSGMNDITSFAGTHALGAEGRKITATKSMRQQVEEVRQNKKTGKRQKR